MGRKTQNMKTKNCEICNIEYHRKPRWGSKLWERQRFCSKSCAGKFRKPIKDQPTKVCIVCDSVFSKPSKQKLEWWNKAQFCSRECRHKIPVSTDTRKKRSVSLMGNKNSLGKNTGILNNNWKGGITTENQKVRSSFEYKEWRTSVFKRDGYKCKMLNDDCTHEIHAHHILRFSEYPELRFDINNGITLCRNHHPLVRKHEQELEPFFKNLILQM